MVKGNHLHGFTVQNTRAIPELEGTLYESKKNEVIASFTNDLEEEYIGNSAKSIFHRPNCNETYRLRMQRSQVRFEHRRDAIEAGYTPCPVCNP